MSPQASGQGRTLYTAEASSARRRLERASAKPVLFMHQLRWVMPVVMVGLLVAGLAVAGWIGAVALIAAASVLSWLAALSWPALAGRQRLLRVTAVACLLVAAAIQAIR